MLNANTSRQGIYQLCDCNTITNFPIIVTRIKHAKYQAYAFFKHVEPGGDTIAGFRFGYAESGCPVLNDIAGYVAGKVVEFVEKGDHSTVIAEVTEAVPHAEAEVLTLKEIGANHGR